MELAQIRCFLAVADTLHFGRAAQQLNMLPAVLGREVQRLESELRTQLFNRSTRRVELSEAGRAFLPGARKLIEDASLLAASVHNIGRGGGKVVRIGCVDSAATGLMPVLLRDVREAHPDIDIVLVEDRTIRLIPRLIAGSLDLAFGRPPVRRDARLITSMLLQENPVIALPSVHPLAKASCIGVEMLRDVPMIVPSRRVRPHSHDLAAMLFASAGLTLKPAFGADEKHTILSMVAAGMGAAIMTRWSATADMRGVVFKPLCDNVDNITLDLEAMWLADVRDEARDAVLTVVQKRLQLYRRTA